MFLIRNFGLSLFVVFVDGDDQGDKRNSQQRIFDKIGSFRCGYNDN